MLNFSERSRQKELLDQDQIPFEDIKRNMKELDFINTYLGGHAISLDGLKLLLSKSKSPMHIVEIGCGGGDNLQVMSKYLQQLNREFTLTGIDIKQECIDFAKEQYPNFNFICSDYKQIKFTDPPSIIFSSLFCHHFYDEALDEVIQWMNENATEGFFINDLHRHPLAYHLIKWLAKFFSSSYLVKHDAPLSVARGFKKVEWQSLLKRNLISSYTIEWKWAFRHLICIRHERA